MSQQKYIEFTGKCSRVLMLTFLLLLSLLIIQLFTLEIIREFFIYNRTSNQSREAQQEPIDHQKLIESSGKLFLPDGTVNLVYRDYKLPEDQQCMIYDLNDNLLWQGKDNTYPDKYLRWSDSTQSSMNYDYLLTRSNSIYPESRRSIIVPVLNDRQILSLWRYNNIKGYFEGFNKNGNIIGYCGSNGFTKEKLQVKPLGKAITLKAWVPVQGGGPIILWADKNDILQIDFRKQIIQTLLHLPDKEIKNIFIHNWMNLSPNTEYYQVSEGYRPMLFCRTEDNSVYVVLRDPYESFQINIPKDLNIYLSNVTATDKKIYMRATYSSLNPPKDIVRNSEAYMKWNQEQRKKPIEFAEELYEVDNAGNITLLNKFEWTRSPREMTISREAILEGKVIKSLAKISPPFYDILSGIFLRVYLRLKPESYRAFWTCFQFTPNFNAYNYMLSLFMAGIVFFHAWPRRKSIASLIGWIVFVFLFNIVGLLVYLALNYTPTIKCHNCNKRRGLITPQCPRCGAELSVTVPGRLSIITEA